MPLTSPTLTVTDNANETATYSITGGNSSATNTVYSVAVSSDLDQPAWSSLFSQTGNGSSTRSRAKGVYWFYCQSVLGDESSISNLVMRQITDGEDSVYIRCKDAIVARLKLLNLEGIGDSVYSRPIPNPADRSYSLPACIVTAQPAPVGLQAATNARDERAYSIQVIFEDAAAKGPNMDENKYTGWRQAAERAFSGQRIDVAEVRRCEIQPALMLDPNDPAYERVVSAFAVVCYAWEPRGLGV